MNQRGAATVELAIGAIAFIALLLLGIYLSELSYFSIKTQEVAAFALYDSTGARTHSFDENKLGSTAAIYRTLRDHVRSEPGEVEDRYKNLDGTRWRNTIQRRLLYTTATAPAVTCRRATGNFSVPNPAAGARNARIQSDTAVQLRRWYRDEAMQCNAELEVASINLPRKFWQEGQGGNANADFSRNVKIHLCGVGRAVNGTCVGGYRVLMGDWAMEGPMGSNLNTDAQVIRHEGDPLPRNRSYRAMVRELFEKSGQLYDANKTNGARTASMEFSRWIGGDLGGPFKGAPSDERTFYMSYAGPEHDYVDAISGAPPGSAPSCLSCHYNTAGTSPVTGPQAGVQNPNWKRLRKPCFLGMPGCRPGDPDP